jgi:hypothetical protein
VKLGDAWRLGGSLLMIDSRTYNRGRVFVAPVPLLTYDFGPARLNAIYAPRMEGNHYSVLGLYLSIPFRQ